MNKNLKLIIEAAVVAVLIAVGAYFYQQAQTEKRLEAELNQNTSVEATSTILLLIDFGSDRLEHFQTQVAGPITAWELLQKGALSLELNLDSQDYGEMGILVKQIGDKKNGDNGQSWIYYVNGEQAQVSASKYQMKPGDKVEWRFEKAPF
jgi:hypothetical protein